MSPLCAQCGHNIPERVAACPRCGAPAAAAVEHAAAVTELVGYEKRRGLDFPKEIANFFRRALNAAKGLARQCGGDIVAVHPNVWEATFRAPGGARPAATAAAEWAQRVRATVRDYATTSQFPAGGNMAVRIGVDAGEGEDLPRDETPLDSARRLRAKAGEWEVLAGETFVLLTTNRFRYRPVGFFQSRGGRAVVKVYRMVEEAPTPTGSSPRAANCAFPKPITTKPSPPSSPPRSTAAAPAISA